MVFTASRYEFPLPSNWPGIRAVLPNFWPFSNFPFRMLTQWRTFARASGTPTVAVRPKFNTACSITGPTYPEKKTLLYFN